MKQQQSESERERGKNIINKQIDTSSLKTCIIKDVAHFEDN